MKVVSAESTDLHNYVPTTTTSMVGDQSMAVRTINVPASPAAYFT